MDFWWLLVLAVSLAMDCFAVSLGIGSSPLPTELGHSDYPPGLVPQTLAPLLEKRVALKQRALALPHWDPRRRKDKSCSAAHKWLLVTCFGYLGYKNARFGRIEAHEAVTT